MSENDSKHEEKLLEIELEQAFETFRGLLSLVVTAFTILITADVALIGYAAANKTALLIGVGAIFPLAARMLLVIIGRMFVPLFQTATSIESRVTCRPDLFFWSLLGCTIPGALPKLKSIAELQEPEARILQLGRELGYIVPPYFPRLLMILAILQVLAVPFIWLAFGWPVL